MNLGDMQQMCNKVIFPMLGVRASLGMLKSLADKRIAPALAFISIHPIQAATIIPEPTIEQPVSTRHLRDNPVYHIGETEGRVCRLPDSSTKIRLRANSSAHCKKQP
jgi:hypothetical protein